MQLQQINRTEFIQMPTDKIKVNGEMVSTARAAEILGVSAIRIRQMIKAEFFAGVQDFGTNKAIPLSEVRRVEAERKTRAKDADGKLKGGRPPKKDRSTE
jgi:hypothetical protein